MPTSRWIRKLVLGAVAAQLIACNEFGGPCGDAVRTASATGDIIGSPGQVLGTVGLNLAESDDSTRSTLTVSVQGALSPDGQALRGHIVRVRILGGEGRLLFDPPVDQLPSFMSPGPLIENLNIRVPNAATLADLRAQFVAGLIVIELTTDESPVRQFTVSTTVTNVSNDFVRAICL